MPGLESVGNCGQVALRVVPLLRLVIAFRHRLLLCWFFSVVLFREYSSCVEFLSNYGEVSILFGVWKSLKSSMPYHGLHRSNDIILGKTRALSYLER